MLPCAGLALYDMFLARRLEFETSLCAGLWDAGGRAHRVDRWCRESPRAGRLSRLAWGEMTHRASVGVWQAQLSFPTLFLRSRNRSFHNMAQLHPALAGLGKPLLFESVQGRTPVGSLLLLTASQSLTAGQRTRHDSKTDSPRGLPPGEMVRGWIPQATGEGRRSRNLAQVL